MILWLDDIRPPWRFGYMGAEWPKTAEDAIEILKTGKVIFASLDHDLSELAMLGLAPKDEPNGMTVVNWMDDNDVYPMKGVQVHSLSELGSKRMMWGLRRLHKRIGCGLNSAPIYKPAKLLRDE